MPVSARAPQMFANPQAITSGQASFRPNLSAFQPHTDTSVFMPPASTSQTQAQSQRGAPPGKRMSREGMRSTQGGNNTFLPDLSVHAGGKTN